MNKAKKTYLIILYSVTLVAIIVGIAIHMGGFFGFFFTAGKSEIVNNRPTNKIDTISLTVDVGDVTIYPGERLEVSCEYPEAYMPKVWDENGVLYVTQKTDTSVKKGIYKIRITIPADSDINLVIESSLGDVKVRDMTLRSVGITLSLGDISLDNVSGEQLKITSNMGDTDVSNCDFKVITAVGNMGDLKIDGDFDEITARTDMGDIKIRTDRPESEISIKADTDLGSVKINGEKR